MKHSNYHSELVLQRIRNLSDGNVGDIVFYCSQDNKEVKANSVLLRNVSKLIDKNLELLRSQEKLRLILDDIPSSAVRNLLQFLYLGK